MKRLSTILFALAISLTAFAQAPEGVNYQAVARDAGGDVLVSENLTVRMTIKESGPAGTTVYQETHNTSTNDFGLFSLTVGQGSVVSGTFSNIDWGSNSHFIQVEVDPGSGYVNLGTTQLVSVPYALYAKEAGNAGTSYNAGTGIDISGNTISNTGDTDPTDDITNTSNAGGDVSGTFNNLSVEGLQGRTVSGTAPSSGEVLKWNGSAWAPANDVGGGAGDDWGSQVVQSDATLTGDGTSGNDLGLAQQGASSGEVLKWNGSTWAPATDNSGTSYAAGAGIDISGNTISNTGDTDASDDITTSTTAGGDLKGTYPDPQVTGLRGHSVAITAPTANDVLQWNAGLSQWEPNAIQEGLWSENSGNLYYDNGYVGIGTSTPSATLHIELAGTNIDDGIQMRSSQGTSEDWYFYMPTSENLIIRDDNDDVLTIENGSGALGVGTTNPTQDLEVADVDGDGDAVLKVGDASGSRVQIGTVEFIEDAGANELTINATIFPDLDNFEDLGTSSLRYNDVYAANGVTTTSDKSAKEDIHPMQYGLDEVMALKPMRYKTKNAHHPVDQYSIGLIAQDVLPVISEVVKTHDWVRTEKEAFKKVPLDRLGINYGALTPILIKSIQEQQHQIEELEENNIQLQEQIEALQKENEELDKRLSDLESQ